MRILFEVALRKKVATALDEINLAGDARCDEFVPPFTCSCVCVIPGKKMICENN
jgi:hypothetical protein